MDVVLAWYHDGFEDDPPELIAVCVDADVARGAIEMHKVARDRSLEFIAHDRNSRARWWTEARIVVGANTDSANRARKGAT